MLARRWDHVVIVGRARADAFVGWLDGAGDRRRWWSAFAVLVVLGGLWLVATPYYGAPDEPNHAVRAASVARGQFLGDERADLDGTGRVVVEVPSHFTVHDTGCFAFENDVPASCQHAGGGDDPVRTVIYVGRYPPLYYLVVGLPALPFSGVGAVYVMRAVSLLASAALAASAVASAGHLRDRRFAGLGLTVALTPMALFLFGVVNPSGPEIAAAVAAWTTGYVLATGGPAIVGDRRLVTRFAVAGVALAVIRPVGLLWLAVVVAALAVLASRDQVARLARSRPVQVAGAAGAVALAGQAVWLVQARSFEFTDPANTRAGTFGAFLRESVGFYWDHAMGQMIGNFGWLDTPLPRGAEAAWLVLAGLVVLCGLARTRVRGLVVIGSLAAASVVVPAVVDALQAPKGFGWQGRYTLPLAVGVGLVAACEVGRGRTRPLFEGRRLFVLAGGLAVVAQTAGFTQAMRRNAVGYEGPARFWSHASWTPHGIPHLVLVGAFLAGVAALAALVLVAVPERPARRAKAAPSPVPSAAGTETTDPLRSRAPIGAEPVTTGG